MVTTINFIKNGEIVTTHTVLENVETVVESFDRSVIKTPFETKQWDYNKFTIYITKNDEVDHIDIYEKSLNSLDFVNNFYNL